MFSLKNIISVLNKEKKDLINLKYLLNNYNSNDWLRYAKFSNENYVRNLIFRNNNYEIFLICWDKNQFSPIHNHSDNGCIYKVLEGELSEYIYDTNNIKCIELGNLNSGSVSYIDNNIGYHKVGNDNKDLAVSLHIYSPPNFYSKFYKSND